MCLRPQCLWLPNLVWCGYTTRSYLHKVKRHFDHAILQDHVKYWVCFISTAITTKACKFGKGDLLWEVSTHKVKQPFEWTRGHVMSSDKWSTYLHYHNAYGYQTWQGGYIQWEASFKPTRPINHMILWFWFSLRLFVSSVTQMPASSAIVQRVDYCARSNPRDLMFNIFAEKWKLSYVYVFRNHVFLWFKFQVVIKDYFWHFKERYKKRTIQEK